MWTERDKRSDSAWARLLAAALVAAILVFAGVRPAHASGTQLWAVAPPPQWIIDPQPSEAAGAAGKSSGDASGERFLLFTHEVRVSDKTESFWHVSRQLTNEAGLQSNSQLNIEFDPSFQKLILHYVKIRRGSDVIDALDPRGVKVAQRQSNLENQVYDSRQSALLFLSDLRVGDVVDYAYSLVGADPTLSGAYEDQVLLGASVPVGRLFCRIIMPKGRKLAFSLHGPDTEVDTALQLSTAPHEVPGSGSSPLDAVAL